MAPKFGTSGLRGLVTELNDDLVADYTRAFLSACPHGGALHLGRDLRPSSPDIAKAVIRTALAEGVPVIDCGALPTPALALSSLAAGQAAIMVTGSHIPADRNGLKFYVPTGEITKQDEQAIQANLGRNSAVLTAKYTKDSAAGAAYITRYVSGFGPRALAGLRIGVYQHSSVARDLMVDVVQSLGGEVVPLARSDSFIPVDTEALDPNTQALLAGWCHEHRLNAVISTDGDADRPMLADETGRIVPGDVLGALTARTLGAQCLCTPISSNSMIHQMPDFSEIHLTRIGSPYVIAAMEAALADTPEVPVAGYEANGGFLLGFEAQGPAGPLAPLMTRDCLLPILAPLAAANKMGQGLAHLVASLPPRFTAADRISGIEANVSQAFLTELTASAAARKAFFGDTETDLDTTDGLRVTFSNGEMVHIRPSGNAPECRCYAEADQADRAMHLVKLHLEKLSAELT
ncbi:phosphomannomutase [uncultured Pelagimonas sp.]|uniref:phosphomannomutase n=1 Tax=uncultured Pelagimonas sp. TaxID=1618102 RepID=UPI0026219668|nr:phosphomannomutase [uncultured Pelagimonas sp.]